MHYCKGNFSRLPNMFALIDPHKNGISITPGLTTLLANKICIFLLKNKNKMHGTSFSHASVCEWSGLFCLKNWILCLIVLSHVGCRQVGEVTVTHEEKICARRITKSLFAHQLDSLLKRHLALGTMVKSTDHSS